MKACQRCDSERLLRVDGKVSDMCSLSYKDGRYNGYVPANIGIGGGDYLEIDLCLECGQVQGAFPVADSVLPEFVGQEDK